MKAQQVKQTNTFKKSALLLAITAAISMPVMAVEESKKNTAEEAKVERMTITATRSALNIDDALTSQVVITRADIDVINPISLQDLLSTLPSVDISNNGGRGQTSSVFLRGNGSDATLILVDGVRVSSATLGSARLNNISPEMIERIEVVQGPRAALWGADAIGGVIQIFTRQLEGGEHFAGVSIGTDEYRKYKAGIGLKHGDGQTTVTVSHERSEGFDVQDDGELDEDGYKFTSIAVRGQQNISEDLSIDWLFSNSEGDNEFDGSFQNNSDINNHAWLVRANYASEFSDVKNNTVFSVGQNRDSSRNFSDFEFKGLFETRRDQFSLVNNSQFSDEFQVNMGVDYYKDDVSNSRTFDFSGNIRRYDDEKRDVTGAFVHALYNGDILSFEATARHDNVGGVDSENTYNLGAGIQINDDSRIVLNHGTGFKVPTFNDLFFPDFGTPTLNSERSETTELFFETRLGVVDTRINFYYSEIDELISRNSAGNAANFDEVVIKGTELSFNLVATGGTHDLNLSYTDAKDQATAEDLIIDVNATDEKLIRRAREKLNYKFTTSINVADLYAEYKFVGTREDSVYPNDRVELGAYQLINLGLNAPLSKNLVLNARVTNLLDKEYQTANTYFTQGRALYVGITYQNF
ncbi:TonB-dependent receptor [Colwellia sp. UCD-KL20]|uniref:TonB-dependent receptor domain-containing protein n=1 Tax=Colwellia sp. UCD-KL20 TaxID=1917165 RepID=UPI000971436E|nr:TonB-dependent receptor [Colwellia sp. UCD-KL20]